METLRPKPLPPKPPSASRFHLTWRTRPDWPPRLLDYLAVGLYSYPIIAFSLFAMTDYSIPADWNSFEELPDHVLR
jgi:hypothetical protein